MTYRALAADLGARDFAVAQGVRNAAEKGETPVSFGYDSGTPTKRADPRFGQERFAGDIFKGKGMEGPFALATKDKKNVQAQQNFKDFMGMYMNGIFGPGLEQV